MAVNTSHVVQSAKVVGACGPEMEQQVLLLLQEFSGGHVRIVFERIDSAECAAEIGSIEEKL